jgi:predicted nucleotidyltransferase component of viral defense system
LLNLARAGDADFQALLVQFAVERFLYRLSISSVADRFVLKGATLFRIWSGELRRPTMDVDLLGSGEATTAAIQAAVATALRVEAPDDGLRFDSASVRAEEIRSGQEYGGVRAHCTAFLGTARIPVQIDVGFGDAVHPKPERAEVPAMLGHPPAVLAVYPPESVVAEKLEAIVSLDLANTRMKDFHDLREISRRFEFDLAVLRAAIQATFERRKTPMPPALPPGLTAAFHELPEKRQQWIAFVERMRFRDVPRDLRQVVEEVGALVAEPLRTMRAGSKRWRHGEGWQ